MAGKKDKVLDKDRYTILLPDLKTCFVCGTDKDIHLHEVFFGTANRELSKEDGLIVSLCGNHHNMSNAGVHYNKQLDNYLKEQAEKIWIDTYTDSSMPYEDRVELFIKRYGKNYLDY